MLCLGVKVSKPNLHKLLRQVYAACVIITKMVSYHLDACRLALITAVRLAMCVFVIFFIGGPTLFSR